MIKVQEAIQAAMAFVAENFAAGNLSPLRLEEVEPSDDGTYWYITVSVFRGPPQSAFAQALVGVATEYRDYKTVTVDASTGTVKSVKIRQLT
jgi:hypothetical protein